MKEVERIRLLLRTVFEGPEAWHGMPIRDLLSGVTAKVAAARPIPRTHSIWELVLHMTYWRLAATAGLDGDPVDPNPAQEESWPKVRSSDEERWILTLEALEASQHALLDRLGRCDDSHLWQKVQDSDYPIYFLLHGVIHHDLYHTGQIALLSKAAGS